MKKLLLAAVMVVGCARGLAQASAIPSAQPAAEAGSEARGRILLDEMVQALGGNAWLTRQDWKMEGRSATFYKGQPHEESPGFEEFYRAKPFAERVIVVTYFSVVPGLLPGKNHRDLAEIWTPDTGYEMSFKGKKELPEKDVAEFRRWRKYSLDTIVTDWLKQPGVVVTYDGSNLAERRLADQVTVMTPGNDVVTMKLDETTHLPLSLSFQWRDPVYKDLNTDEEQFEDYHLVQGIQTPYSVTQLHNGQMTSQRFLTKVSYNLGLSADLFDPDRPLEKKAK